MLSLAVLLVGVVRGFEAMPSPLWMHQKMRHLHLVLLVPAALMLCSALWSGDVRQVLHMVPLCGLLMVSTLRLRSKNAMDFYCSGHLRGQAASTLVICFCMILSFIDTARTRAWVGFAEVAIVAPEAAYLKATRVPAGRAKRARWKQMQLPLFHLWIGAGLAMCCTALFYPNRMTVVLDEWGVISLVLEKMILGALGDFGTYSLLDTDPGSPQRARSCP
ncbi:hypothetical protein AK812_SmicGene22502 [Symbiodinium microadriaticum]|uniref:Uncharacterized protein n=1 Tax=Symbiodinium microadriaticum TaxID=2951 RepID=A0A1Q9DJP2_SYMMI|nr:hypothetical protein AK812_SmicGene22502 [Symbiodinium microadriaticum]